MIASRSVNITRHPRDKYIVIPLHYNDCCLWSGHTRKQSNALALSPINKKVGTRCAEVHLTSGSGRMQFTLHATRRTPHGASRLVQVMSASRLVKTQRAPSRHSRDARVYGHKTTAHGRTLFDFLAEVRGNDRGTSPWTSVRVLPRATVEIRRFPRQVPRLMTLPRKMQRF